MIDQNAEPTDSYKNWEFIVILNFFVKAWSEYFGIAEALLSPWMMITIFIDI